jgi:hypothetical protein
MLGRVFDGHEATGPEFMALADGAVARFPFDPDIRKNRMWVRSQVDAGRQ